MTITPVSVATSRFMGVAVADARGRLSSSSTGASSFVPAPSSSFVPASFWSVLTHRNECLRLSSAAWPAAPGVVATNASDDDDAPSPPVNPPLFSDFSEDFFEDFFAGLVGGALVAASVTSTALKAARRASAWAKSPTSPGPTAAHAAARRL